MSSDTTTSLRSIRKVLEVQVARTIQTVVNKEAKETSEPPMELGNPKVVSDLVTLVLEYSKGFVADLAAFSKHAGRKTIHVNDILLCARKSKNMTKALKRKMKERDDDKNTTAAAATRGDDVARGDDASVQSGRRQPERCSPACAK